MTAKNKQTRKALTYTIIVLKQQSGLDMESGMKRVCAVQKERRQRWQMFNTEVVHVHVCMLMCGSEQQ